MKRIIYTLALGAFMAAPFCFMPVSGRANGPERDAREVEWYRSRDLTGRAQWMERERLLRNPFARPMAGNSVPLNEGQIFLIIAGLGLGARMLYHRRKLAAKSVV